MVEKCGRGGEIGKSSINARRNYGLRKRSDIVLHDNETFRPQELNIKVNKRLSIFSYQPHREPTDSEIKVMLVWAAMLDIRVIMKNHTFKFRHKFYMQSEGSSIGNELIEEMAKQG